MPETRVVEFAASELDQVVFQPLPGIEGCAPAPEAGFPPARHALYVAT
jgi:hypothetical protein